MFITKTRATILTLVAMATMAIAALAPAVSQAQYHNYCIDGHCVTHTNYTYANPCAAKSAALISEEEAEKIHYEAEQERKKEEEERQKQKGEEKEGEVHQGEIEKSFYGCGVGVTKGSQEVTPPPVRVSPVLSRVSAVL